MCHWTRKFSKEEPLTEARQAAVQPDLNVSYCCCFFQKTFLYLLDTISLILPGLSQFQLNCRPGLILTLILA